MVNIYHSSTRQSWSRNRSVGTTRPWAGLSGFRFLAGAEISTFCRPPRAPLASTTESKAAGREAKYSPPFSAEFKHKWSYTSAPHTRLHGMHRNDFSFVFYPQMV